MATPGELTKSTAVALNVPLPTIVVHDRALADAGYRTSAGRGRSAPHVTARDGAHLIVAILASSQIKDSARSVERYSRTQPRRALSSPHLFNDAGVPELAALPATHSLMDALEALLAAAGVGSLSKDGDAPRASKSRARRTIPQIEMTVQNPATNGEIRISGTAKGVVASVRYTLPNPWEKRGGKAPASGEIDAWEADAKRRAHEPNIETQRRIEGRPILEIARAIANARRHGDE